MPDTAAHAELDLDGAGPLHEQIRRAIAAKIINQHWRPGHRIPFESELAAGLKTSRMTVNRALSALAADGLVVRRRKAGSFVAGQSAIHAPLTILSPEREVARMGLSHRFDLRSRRMRDFDPDTDGTAGFARGEKLLHLVCLHHAGDEPFLLEDRLVSLTAVPQAAEVDFSARSPGSWLLEHVPWNEAEHEITAIAADTPTARALAIDPGAPCLSIQRRTWHGDTPTRATVTAVRLTYPGAAKKLVGRFRPGGLG